MTTNVNILSQTEWRKIHNALSEYQNQLGSIFLTEYATKQKQEIQVLMDKVRDNYIEPTT